MASSQETKSQNPYVTPAVRMAAREPNQTGKPNRPVVRQLISTGTKKPEAEQQEAAATTIQKVVRATAAARALEEAEARAAEGDGGVQQPAGMRLGRARARSDDSYVDEKSDGGSYSYSDTDVDEKSDGGSYSYSDTDVDEKSDGGSYSYSDTDVAPPADVAPAADNASSSVWANVKEIFNIRFNPLSGEALSRMYQQPAQRTTTATPPTTIATQPPTTTIETQAQPADYQFTFFKDCSNPNLK